MQYGSINTVRLGRDPTGRSKGFAHIEFSTVEEATTAVNEAYGTVFEGRPLRMGHASSNKRDNNRQSRAQNDDWCAS